MTGLFELLTNKYWMVSPDYVHAIRGLLQRNLSDHTPLDSEKTASVIAYLNAEGKITDMVSASHDDDENYDGASEERKDQFVTVLYLDGPVTRNGDACSYGSRELRDILKQAADSEQCLGHLFYINTPGGSAWAANDFKQAIDYAHSKGQKVYAFIDGMCASAGMYLAALCDERYYCNPKDKIGCIGVMAAFYTEADGSKCEYTNETYHELYDPESFDKNKEIRDIANDGNTELLVAELAKLGMEFRADVKKGCPNVKDEHLHGKMFDAADVEGILVDGQRSFSEVVRYIAASSNAAREPKNTLTPNNIDMKEKFPALFAALAVEEMQMTDEGAFLNTGLLETLNAAIEAKNKEVADAEALADQLTAEKAELEQKLETANSDHTAAIETLKADNEKAVEDLKAEHATTIEEKDNTISALEQEKADLVADQTAKAEQIETLSGQLTEKQTELDGAKASLETAQNTIAERDQQISDLNAQVEELTKGAGQEPAAGASPQNNGGGAGVSEVAVSGYVYDTTKSYEENMRLKKEFVASK